VKSRVFQRQRVISKFCLASVLTTANFCHCGALMSRNKGCVLLIAGRLECVAEENVQKMLLLKR
jgi:hypothetical protein